MNSKTSSNKRYKGNAAYYQNLGNRIKTLREQKGITQKDFAEQLRYDPSYISRIEQGQYMITLPLLSNIAEFFHVPIYYFLEENGVETPDFYYWKFLTKNCSPAGIERLLEYVSYIVEDWNTCIRSPYIKKKGGDGISHSDVRISDEEYLELQKAQRILKNFYLFFDDDEQIKQKLQDPNEPTADPSKKEEPKEKKS